MKIATKLTKKVAEFVNEQYIRNFHPDESDYLHFDSEMKPTPCMFSELFKGYALVSEQEFIDMVTAELFKEAQKPKEMKTKCIVLGQENEPKKELKKIELKKCMQVKTGDFSDLGGLGPNIDLNEKFTELALNPTYKIEGYDLIHATTRSGSYQIWLGHWNDGVA